MKKINLQKMSETYLGIVASIIKDAAENDDFAKSEKFASIINKHISSVKKLSAKEIYMSAFLEFFKLLSTYFKEKNIDVYKQIMENSQEIKQMVLINYIDKNL